MDGASDGLMPTTLGPDQQQHLLFGSVTCNRFAQCPDRGAVAEQRTFDPPPRVGEEFLRHGELTRELLVSGLELTAQALQREVRVDARDDFILLKGFRDEI